MLEKEKTKNKWKYLLESCRPEEEDLWDNLSPEELEKAKKLMAKMMGGSNGVRDGSLSFS